MHHLILAVLCPLFQCTPTAASTDRSVAKVCIFAKVSASWLPGGYMPYGQGRGG